jgi:hypothetical protein
MSFRAFICRWSPGVGVLLAWLLPALWASADETDNFYLPLAPEFADLGDYLENVHTWAIEQGVREVNNRIERALNLKAPVARARRLDECHSPDTLADAVADQFGNPLTERQRVERALRRPWARETFPNKTVMHHDSSMNFRGHKAFDPRALLMLFQSQTISAYGVYFGTDKLLHFHQVGHRYYRRYRSLIRQGLTPDEARQEVLKYFGEGSFLAEDGAFGTVTTGVYSNGDMAANYVGLKFFLNLTESVVLRGREHEPLVLRCGVFWRVNDQVRHHSGWFRDFISDHWNEALNPSLYDSSMRKGIRRILESRARPIVEFYTLKCGHPNDPAHFEELVRTLSTYAGEPYGHSGQFEKLIHIGNACIPALRETEAKLP